MLPHLILTGGAALLDFHLLFFHNERYWIANAVSSVTITPPEQSWTREATLKDMTATLSAFDVEFLDSLAEHYEAHEIDAVAETLGISREQLAAWYKDGLAAAEPLDIIERYYRTEVVISTMGAVTRAHGAVSTPSILNASPAELREGEEYYDERMRDYFSQMRAIEETITSGQFSDNDAWAKARAKFEEYAGYLWQCRARLGVNVMTGSLKRATPETD